MKSSIWYQQILDASIIQHFSQKTKTSVKDSNVQGLYSLTLQLCKDLHLECRNLYNMRNNSHLGVYLKLDSSL